MYNLGIDGQTSAQILARFDHEVKPRLWLDARHGFILACGINDSLVRANGSAESTPAQFREHLRSLVRAARVYGSDILVCDITPVDETKTTPLPSSSSGKTYTNGRIALFNDAADEVCEEEGVESVRVSDVFSGSDYASLLADGLHPADEGHARMADMIYDVIRKWLDADGSYH